MNLGITMQRFFVGTAFLLIFIGVCRGQGLVPRATDSWNYIQSWTLQPATESLWIIQTEDANKVIHMELLDLNIGDDLKSCNDNYLRITEMGEIWGTFCQGAGPSLTSQGNLVEVRVRVGRNTTGRGFRMRYRQTDPLKEDSEGHCGEYIFLNETRTTYLTSPGFPDPMTSNTECMWVLESTPKTQIQIRVIDMSSSNCSLHLNIMEVEDTVSVNACRDRDINYVSKQNNVAIYLKHQDKDESYFNVSVEVISDAHEVCGRTINITRILKTQIVSPGFPALWSEDTNCTWVVQGLPDFRIRVEGVDVKLSDCSYHLALSEGNMETVRFCSGDNINFVTAKHEVAIHLRNPKKRQVYFQLNVSITVAAPSIHGSCPSKETPDFLIATSRAGIIASKNYNYSNYEGGMNCYWLIKAQDPFYLVEVTITNSSIEKSNLCRYDYLAGYNGTSAWEPPLFQWCGWRDQTYKSPSRYLTLVFHTDSVHEDKGFLLTYRQVPAPQFPGIAAIPTTPAPGHPPTRCGGNLYLSANGTHIVSPGFPVAIPPFIECTWYIETPPSTRIRIQAVETNLEDCSFQLTFSEEKEAESTTICEGKSLDHVTRGNQVTILLKNVQKDGTFFNLSISVLHETPKSSCGGAVHLGEGEMTRIVSPGHPNPMPLHVACLWHVVAPAHRRIRLQNLDSVLVNCGFYLGLYPDNDTEIVRFCDGPHIDFVTETNQIFIFMKNHGTPGVRLNLLATTSFSPPTLHGTCPTLHADNALVATSTPQELASKNYKYSNYDSNMDCTWVIRADRPDYFVQVKLENSSVQETPHCTHDFLAGYDGPDRTAKELFKWCGNESKVFTSSSNYMTLLFKSDSRIEDRGFHLQYSTIGEMTTKSDHMTVVTAVLVLLGVAVAIAIAITVFWVVKKRQEAQRDVLEPVLQSTPQNQNNRQPAPTCCGRLRQCLFGNNARTYAPSQVELVGRGRSRNGSFDHHGSQENVAGGADSLEAPVDVQDGNNDRVDPSTSGRRTRMAGTADPGIRHVSYVDEDEGETFL